MPCLIDAASRHYVLILRAVCAFTRCRCAAIRQLIWQRYGAPILRYYIEFTLMFCRHTPLPPTPRPARGCDDAARRQALASITRQVADTARVKMPRRRRLRYGDAMLRCCYALR